MRESTIRTICVCFTLLFSGQAFAFSGGITGYSGNPAVTGDNAAIDRKAGLYQKAIKTFRSISNPPASVHALISVCFVNMELHEESEREMQHYLELVKQQMSVLPRNEDDWRQLWRNSLPYQYDEDFNEIFDMLVQAGLLGVSMRTLQDCEQGRRNP